MVDLASPVTLINWETWCVLNDPEYSVHSKVNQLNQLDISRRLSGERTNRIEIATLTFYVSRKGVNILGSYRRPSQVGDSHPPKPV